MNRPEEGLSEKDIQFKSPETGQSETPNGEQETDEALQRGRENLVNLEVEHQTPETKGRNWISNTKETLKSVLGSIFSTKAEMTNRFWNATTKINGILLAGLVTKAIANPEVQKDIKIAASSLVALGLTTFAVATYDSYSARKKEAEREVADGAK